MHKEKRTNRLVNNTIYIFILKTCKNKLYLKNQKIRVVSRPTRILVVPASAEPTDIIYLLYCTNVYTMHAQTMKIIDDK